VNRFFRSAFFPLIVIVLLVWLASQTLIPKHSNARPGVTYSSLRQDIQQHPEDIKTVIFSPGKRQIGVKYVDGKSATVHYPTDQSELDFEKLLQQKSVLYDSKGTGGFSWMALIGSFLPFLLSFVAIGRLRATPAGIVATTEVIFGFAVAWLWLGEALDTAQLIGAFIVLAGVGVAQTARRREPAPAFAD